jgi:hypothetical protein
VWVTPYWQALKGTELHHHHRRRRRLRHRLQHCATFLYCEIKHIVISNHPSMYETYNSLLHCRMALFYPLIPQEETLAETKMKES